MDYGILVALGASCALLGGIIGNSKLVVSTVAEVIEFIRRRPTRTKRLETAMASVCDTLGELKDDHRYVEQGMEILLFAMMAVIDGNGSRAEAQTRLRDFVSHRHAPC